MSETVQEVTVHLVDLSQDKPYLGELREGEEVNRDGYFVRKGNRTVYPRKNRSLVVRVATKGGIFGWGETYGLVAPKAPGAIINDLLSGFVIGRDPSDVETIHDDLYNLMRVRGYTGGFYLDALAALDIALWDIRGKVAGKPLGELLGGDIQKTIPSYVSGLPENTLGKRCGLACSWQDRGFSSFKFALPVADDGAAEELRALRSALGTNARIACDLHWSLDAGGAIQLASEMAEDRPWFLEAPVPPEDIGALAKVASQSGQTIAAGEEWRTLWEARHRIDAKACHIVQPEMGHTGITQFLRMGRYASENGLRIIPHATIGAGIFLAASLHASSALSNLDSHEFQHSVFEPFRHFTGGSLACERGAYTIPKTPGIGVEPSQEMLAAMTLIE